MEEKLSKLPTDAARATPARTEKDLLEEVLELVRDQARSSTVRHDELFAQRLVSTMDRDRDFRQSETYALFSELKAFLVDRDKSLRNILHRRLDGTAPTVEEIKTKVCEALVLKLQPSAADALRDARWSRTDGDVVVETELSKTMLAVVINSEVHKISLKAMADLGEFSDLRVLPSKTLTERILSTPR